MKYLSPSQARILYITCAGLVFTYVLLRAVLVPITHDEAATFFHYIFTENFLPYLAHWDANNHFLTSFLAWISYRLLGSDIIWLRLPNVLAFVLYAWCVWKLSLSIGSVLLRLLLACALITNPFVSEFFSQCRGYGLGLAFLMAMLLAIYRFLKYPRSRDHFLLWLCTLLALLANLSLMNSALVALGIVGLRILSDTRLRRRPLTWLIYMGLGWLSVGLAAGYSFTLREKELLYYGSDKGFAPNTIGSLAQYNFQFNPPWFNWSLCILGAVMAVVLLYASLKRKFIPFTPGDLSALFLLLNAVGVLLLNWLFGVNFPEDRVGIYFIPLFVLTLGYFLQHISTSPAYTRLASLVLLLFPLLFLGQANLRFTRLWRHLSVSEALFKEVEQAQKSSSDKLVVSGYRLSEMSWAYHNMRANGSLAAFAHHTFDPDHLSDYVLYVDTGARQFLSDYRKVREDAAGIYLLKRKAPLHWDTLITVGQTSLLTGTGLYADAFRSSDNLRWKEANFLARDFSLAAPECPPEINLILTASDSEGKVLMYDFIPLQWIRGRWSGRKYHFKRPMNLPEQAQSLVVYFWNIDNSHIQLYLNSLTLLKASPVQP